MNEAIAKLVRRSPIRLVGDKSRVITTFFVPGQEGFDETGSRSSAVVARILALSEEDVERSYLDVLSRFEGRHRDLIAILHRHAAELADRLDTERALSEKRELLLGAAFTSEYAIEGTSLCNPSMVVHPDQTGVPVGSVRFVMSVRAIGEGHRSSIGFRTGLIDGHGEVSIESPSRFATTGTTGPVAFDAAVFRGELRQLHGSGENADYVLDGLGEHFSAVELEERLNRLKGQVSTRRHAAETIALFRDIGELTYGVEFPLETSISERVLMPVTIAESNGMEDARFVRFEDDDQESSYFATYTAFNGTDISVQLLETGDFRSFSMSPIVGPAAGTKGLALFPRKIGGRFAALSRFDRESNFITFSNNLRDWEESFPCQMPTCSWEAVQLGNCGSPIETEAGWLVLTHGVGPMRVYSIGAILLDLKDPTHLVGRLHEPLITPTPDEQDGYVPNVVYSCGALVHADTVIVPYGIGDFSIGVASVPLRELLEALSAGA